MTPGENQLRQARFWKKLLLLTRGRIDVLHAMDVIVAEEPEDAWRDALTRIRAALREGQSLGDALGAQPELFSRGVRELVRSAERTGAWEEILPLVAEGLADGTLN